MSSPGSEKHPNTKINIQKIITKKCEYDQIYFKQKISTPCSHTPVMVHAITGQGGVGFYGLRNVDMKTEVSMFRVACHHLSGK
jgi:hypothetical protein